MLHALILPCATIGAMPNRSPASARLAATLALASLAALAVGGGGGCVSHADLDAQPRTAPAAVDAFDDSHAPAPARSEVQVGYATWYGAALAGRTTASGERFDPEQMTAAHRHLPFGTWVEVTRVDSGQRVRVRITDRGPFGHEDRIIDLSHGAAAKIDLVKAGVTKVQLRIVDGP
jgi:rare lipoprotein A